MSALYCSFCGKAHHECRKLVAGPTAFICETCHLNMIPLFAEEAKDLADTLRISIEVLIGEITKVADRTVRAADALEAMRAKLAEPAA